MGIPADNLNRNLIVASADAPTAVHLSLVGNTYTILVSGGDTEGRYSLIDMYVPVGGGPPPHRHDCEESFTVLEGEIEATFRGETVTVKTGQVIQIPANAPHQFRNISTQPARLLCICSPAGQEGMFREIGVEVPTRTTTLPKPDAATAAAFKAKAQALAPKYKTEFV
jgi:mannose-6-phosphate isomerase-like protein (cupin superfamily)